jgi:hypothetical protein
MEIGSMNMQVLHARRDTSGGHKVDVGRGERVGRVSSEWFSRPADERYLSLSELARTVRDRTERSRTRVVESALIHVEANRNDSERLTAVVSANGRAQALSEAERAAAAEQGREQRRRFLTPGSGYQPGNARMFPGNGN